MGIDNTKKLNSDEIKSRILEILLYFKSICERNEIPYSLAYGTLLGAVRHQGFIPWDDDVDVCLLRDDYDRLIEALCKDNNDRFKLIYSGNNETYYYNFAKLVDNETCVIETGSKEIDGYGLFIDIFPLDKCSSEQKAFTRQVNKIKRLSHLRSAAVCTGKSPALSGIRNFFRIAISPITKIFGFKFWLKKEEKVIQKYRNAQSDYVVCLEEIPAYCEIIEKRKLSFDNTIIFEGISFSCFNDYDEYLKNRYGDYMKLPPEEKRVSRHGYKAILK